MKLSGSFSHHAAVGVAAAVLAGAPAASAATLGLHGIGPLRLGMSHEAAVATGWLAHRGTGCPLGGTPPVTYRVDGRNAPAAVRGTAEFTGGRLSEMSFTAGVRTTAGVRVGHTTPARMVARYRKKRGFRASSDYEEIFRGTFVTVTRGGRAVVGAFADGPVISVLAIPAVSVCE